MIEPYPFQTDAIESIYTYFQTNRTGNPLLALPTGTGKSVVIAFFIKQVMERYRNQRILCVTHQKELIEQNYLEHKGIWPDSPCGIFSASMRRKEHKFPIIFCGIQSVFKKWELFGKIDLIVIDEAHLVSPKSETMYQTFINRLKQVNPLVRVIGLSATCWRLGHGSLTENHIFTDICYDLTTIQNFNWLIQEGYLSPVVPMRTTEFYNLEGVQLQGGEYNQKQLQERVDRKDTTYKVLEELVPKAADRKHWLIFATGISHSEEIARSLSEDFGIVAFAIHSNQSPELRQQLVSKFKQGKIRCLVNTDLLTTGFNFRPIDFIGIMRPTQSSSLWVQMLGRGTRVAEGKENCMVADFARNTERLGPINDPVIPRAPGQKKEKGVIPVKICPKCDCYNHLSATTCEICGHEFPRNEVQLTNIASELELIRKPVEAKIIKCYVKHMTFEKYTKTGKPPSLKVTYYCNQGATIFSQYLGFEHVPFVRHKARCWWRNLAGIAKSPPFDTNEALTRTGELRKILNIWVDVAQKYPEILAIEQEHVDASRSTFNCNSDDSRTFE